MLKINAIEGCCDEVPLSFPAIFRRRAINPSRLISYFGNVRNFYLLLCFMRSIFFVSIPQNAACLNDKRKHHFFYCIRSEILLSFFPS